MGAAYILHFVYKYFTRAICIEEKQVVHKYSQFPLKVHYTLIKNKMLVALAFRSSTILLYTLSCINNIEL